MVWKQIAFWVIFLKKSELICLDTVKSSERSSAIPQHTDVVPIEKGAFRSPSTTVSQLTYLRLIICLHTVKWLQVLLFNANNSI